MVERGNDTMRADAVRNREHLLSVARDALSADGATSLNVIAKQAGVGPGTLYRHFPTREDLILAVYRRDVLSRVEEVHDVIAQHAPLDAFRIWFERLADDVRVKHGLGEALHSAAARHAVDETYAPVTAAVGVLLDACVGDGSMRPGLDPADVLLVMGFLWRVADDDAGRAQAARVMTIIVEGLRSRSDD